MKIDKFEIDTLTIIDKENNKVLASLNDERIHCSDKIGFRIIPKTEPIPEGMIAHEGEYLYYKDTPSDMFVVTEADNSFFTMIKAELTEDKKNITFNQSVKRKYPNNKFIGTLEDYGLALVTLEEKA